MLSRWPFRVKLPDNEEKDLGRVCVSRPSMRIKFGIVQNCAVGGDRKREEDEIIKLEILQTMTLYKFEVLVGDGEERKKTTGIRKSAERIGLSSVGLAGLVIMCLRNGFWI